MIHRPATRIDSDRLAEIMESALQIEAPERDAFLGDACAGDTTLLAEVQSLLASHEAARPWLAVDESNSEGDVSLAAGERVGAYEIVAKIGEGGFGDVYRARQIEPMRRDVAIKIIKPGMDSRQVIARFDAERQALALMNHPNIAGVFEAGMTSAGRSYFVMELVDGEPLTAHCDRARLSIRERLLIFRQICLAVQHAHSKGIIHRDLKPTNVLVTIVDGRDVPKVIDFGIAKATTAPLTSRTALTGRWQLVGTPEYMSPEQADPSNADVDTRSDVYSLGVLLYELLTGTTPHDRERLRTKTWSELQRIIREEDAVKPSSLVRTLVVTRPEVAERRRHDPQRLSHVLRGDLDWIVAKALAKEPHRRYATASALADDVQRFLNHQPVFASPPSTAYHLRKFVRRHRVAVTLVIAANLALLFALATLLVALNRIEMERDTARDAESAADDSRMDSEATLAVIVQMLSAGDPTWFGRDVTVRETLDDIARDINVVFAGESEVRSRILLALGATYLGIGDLAAAESHLREAFESSRAMLGESDPRTLDAMTHLGVVYRRQARYDLAEQMLEPAVALASEKHGELHAATIRARAALGALRYYQGNGELAETHLTNALGSAMQVFGPEHPDTIAIMENLAETYAMLGRPEDAETLTRDAIDALTRHCGAEHPKTLHASSKLGQRYVAARRFEDAKELLAKVSEASDRVLGADHPQSIETAAKLGAALHGLKDLDGAEPLFVRVLELRTEMLGEQHPETMAALNNLASVYMERGEFVRAEPLFHRTIAAIEATDGPTHQRTLIAKYNLARLYMDTSRFEDAEGLLAQVSQAAESVPGPGPDFLPATLNHYGRCLVALERFDDAETALLRAHQLFEQARGPHHAYTQGAVRSLVALYERCGRTDSAAEWRTRLDEPAPAPESPAAPADEGGG